MARHNHLTAFHASCRKEIRLTEFYKIREASSLAESDEVAWACCRCNKVMTKCDATMLSSRRKCGQRSSMPKQIGCGAGPDRLKG